MGTRIGRWAYEDGLFGEDEVEEASGGIGAIGPGEVEDGGHGLQAGWPGVWCCSLLASNK